MTRTQDYKQWTPLFRYLDETGDGTGNKDITGDYSSTVTDFKIAPPSDKVYYLARMIIHYEDTAGFTPSEFANFGAVLTNGIDFICVNNGVQLSLTDSMLIKTNSDWSRLSYDMGIDSFGSGNPNQFIKARWTFARSGRPLRFNGGSSDEFVCRVNDNLTGLINFNIQMQGYSENR